MAFDEKWLASLEDKFAAETKNLDSGFKTLDDGKYVMKLEKVEIGESKKGNKQVVWDYTVMEGELAGENHKVFDGLERDDAFKWLGLTLRRFGIDIADIGGPRGLPKVFQDLTEAHPMVIMSLKSKKSGDQVYQNSFVDKVLDADYASGGDSDKFELKKGVRVVYKDPGGGTDKGLVVEIDTETESVTVRLDDESEEQVPFEAILGPAS